MRVRVTLYLFFGTSIVAADQSMGWRRKKLQIGNQLGSYCYSQLRANEGEPERETKDARGILEIKQPQSGNQLMKKV